MIAMWERKGAIAVLTCVLASTGRADEPDWKQLVEAAGRFDPVALDKLSRIDTAKSAAALGAVVQSAAKRVRKLGKKLSKRDAELVKMGDAMVDLRASLAKPSMRDDPAAMRRDYLERADGLVYYMNKRDHSAFEADRALLVLAHASKLLKRYRSVEALEKIVVATTRGPAISRYVHTLALDETGHVSVIPHLLKLSKGGDFRVRLAAIRALEAHRREASVAAALNEATTDKNPTVARVAKLALKRRIDRVRDGPKFSGRSLESKRALFLVDASVARPFKFLVSTPEHSAAWNATKEILECLEGAPKDFRFDVVVFGTEAHTFSGRMGKADARTIKSLRAWFAEIPPAPLCNVHAGFEAAFRSYLRPSFRKQMTLPDTIYVFAARRPEIGRTTDIRVLAELVRLWNRSLRIRIVYDGDGKSHEQEFGERIARGNGHYRNFTAISDWEPPKREPLPSNPEAPASIFRGNPSPNRSRRSRNGTSGCTASRQHSPSGSATPHPVFPSTKSWRNFAPASLSSVMICSRIAQRGSNASTPITTATGALRFKRSAGSVISEFLGCAARSTRIHVALSYRPAKSPRRSAPMECGSCTTSRPTRPESCRFITMAERRPPSKRCGNLESTPTKGYPPCGWLRNLGMVPSPARPRPRSSTFKSNWVRRRSSAP